MPAEDTFDPTVTFAQRLAIRLHVNGDDVTAEVQARTTLLDWLRESLGLTGAKKGCNEGACGTCTVLVNGDHMNSCLTLAVQCDGHSVVTVEGLAAPGEDLHPVQRRSPNAMPSSADTARRVRSCPRSRASPTGTRATSTPCASG